MRDQYSLFGWSTQVTDQSHLRILIARNAKLWKFKTCSKMTLYNVVYSGEAAIFLQQQHYSGSFACSFDVFHYPFDVQVCKVLVQLSSVREEVVRFSQERAKVVYLEDVNLPSYIVTRYEAFVTTRGTEKTKYSVVEVEFELTRRWTVIVLSVYFPTSLLLIVGYATLFVSVSQLEIVRCLTVAKLASVVPGMAIVAFCGSDMGEELWVFRQERWYRAAQGQTRLGCVRLTVSVTTLLVLYTLFNNTSDSLPPTAYIKMIDVWFFACILLLFAVIVTHVYVEHLENGVAGGAGGGRGPSAGVVGVAPAAWEKGPVWAEMNGKREKRRWWGRLRAWTETPLGVLRAMRSFVVPVAVAVFMVVYWTVMFGG
ncbi:uncharacterized protein LOC134785226 [Penaeus indicus]|uniref:uncharacterized protein LOC134785226 n=1 Tax=Penaeus indicus TaxID=29960 RepID=UPI00300CC51D